MKTTRRELIRMGIGGSALLAGGLTVPTFLARSALAMTEAKTDGKILVVLQLDGGNDGLNTVVPHADDTYQKSRPKLALKAKDIKPIDDRVGLHASLDSFAKLLEDGRLAIVQSVGYPNPNRSHFESMAIWQTARAKPGVEEPGWLARAIDASPARPGDDAPALHIARQALPQALRGGRQHVPSLATLEQFHRRLGMPENLGTADQRAALDAIAGGGGAGGDNPLLQFVTRSTLVSYASSARLESVLKNDEDTQPYPEDYGLAQRLKLIASLIRSGLSTPIYYTQLGGFDTHANQLYSHPGLLRELGRSLLAFLNDLDHAGIGERVAVLVFSEFGRRLRENASGGTDHGTAGPVFLLGKGVAAGLQGPYPDLSVLEGGDPSHAIDFRSVYATVLDRWLNLPAESTLGAVFEPLPLFRS